MTDIDANVLAPVLIYETCWKLRVSIRNIVDWERHPFGTQVWEIVGMGWPLTQPDYDSGSIRFVVEGKGIATSVGVLDVPHPAPKKWQGHQRGGEYEGYERYSETVINSPIPAGGSHFVGWLWGAARVRGPRTVMIVGSGGIDGSDFAYANLMNQAEQIARMGNKLIDMRSSS